MYKFPKNEPSKKIENILTSQCDDPSYSTSPRKYRYIELENGLRVFIVSDESTEKSACAVNVSTGSWMENDEIPGLAHFLEHMLFMGTEIYPSENEYSSFLSSHGGSSNAWTGGQSTNYYFDVGSEYLDEAMMRFSPFFHCPLFDSNGTLREIMAVNSEHEKNLNNDGWRLHQLDIHLSHPTHPYSKFGTGNVITLKEKVDEWNIDLRKSLIEFHNLYYVANNMTCCILGKESLDYLENVVKKSFSLVPSGKFLPNPTLNLSHPYHLKNVIVFVKPVKPLRILELSWPMKDYKELYRWKPCNYLSHLLGHEAEGSLLTELKRQGLANGLSAGEYHGGDGFGFFKISIDLSPQGMPLWKDVVKYVSEYIQTCLVLDEKSWEECCRLSHVNFRFKEKSTSVSNFVSKISNSMGEYSYSPQEILSGPYLMDYVEKDGKLSWPDGYVDKVKECIDCLNWNNVKITLVGEVDELIGGEEVIVKHRYTGKGIYGRESGEILKQDDYCLEPWYGTPYRVEKLEKEFIDMLKNPKKNNVFHLPKPNQFIPIKLPINNLGDVTVPKLIRFDEKMWIFHHLDDQFCSPKTSMIWTWRNPLVYTSAYTSTLARLWCNLVRDSLSEDVYDAQVVGMDFSLDMITEGISLSLEGYTETMSLFLHKILNKMKNVSLERFHVMKEQLERRFISWNMESPQQHASWWCTSLLQQRIFTNDEKLQALNEITLEDLQDWSKRFWQEGHLEGLISGVMTREESLKLADEIWNIMECKRSISWMEKTNQLRTIVLPESNFIYKKMLPNSENPNSAIEWLIQFPPLSRFSDKGKRIRVLTQLFSQFLSEPCFDTLRTKEQLGYLVWSGVKRQTGVVEYRIIIQSTRHPRYLEDRIESFVRGFVEGIKDMKEEFERHVKALKIALEERPKNLGTETARFWSAIATRSYNFYTRREDVEELEKLTLNDLVEYCNEYVLNNRRKISVWVISQQAKEEGEAEGEFIQDFIEWKNRQELAAYECGIDGVEKVDLE